MSARPVTPAPGGVGWTRSVVLGLISGACVVLVAEVVALLVAPSSGPFATVGSLVIDNAPGWVKDAVITVFGTGDKLFLLVALAVVAAVVAAVAGVLESAWPPAGSAVVAAAGVMMTAAAVTRADASGWAFLPPVVGALAGMLVLRTLVARAAGPTAGGAGPATPHDTAGSADAATAASGPSRASVGAAARAPTWGRRGFLQVAGVAAFGLIVVGVVARVRDTAASSIAAARRAVRLPAPRHTLAVPAGAQLDVPGITPLFTSNADFYRVDTALNIPAVDPSDWQLTVDGMVDHTVRLSFTDLLALGVDEYDVTLTCVSNEVGGDLIGNARWLGVPVRTILRRAIPHASADMVLSRSVDGFTAGTPLELLTDDHRDAILAVGMNGQPLPLAHGFPVRMIVPGLYGYVSATKWLQQLTVTTFAASTAYWTSRGYSARAPVKMSSRIDTPGPDAAVAAGPVKVAGVAWAQPVGVSRVEVRIDDGPWRRARLATPLNGSTWVQWVVDWNAARGGHTLTVRAVDRHGTVQDGVPRGVVPNGATGWDQTVVQVT